MNIRTQDPAVVTLLEQWHNDRHFAPLHLGSVGLADVLTYQIRSRREIIVMLRRLCNAEQQINLLAPTHPDGVGSVIREVDESDGSVILSLTTPLNGSFGPQPVMHETALDGVRIFFYAALQPCSWRGRLGFRIAIPDIVIRLQRREYYRVPTKSEENNFLCSIADGELVLEVQPRNLSVGGIGVIDKFGILPTDVGRIHENCVINFRNTPLVLTLELRNAQRDRLVEDKSTLYLGYRFSEPSRSQLAIIQGYVLKLEQRKNAERKTIG